MIRSVDDVQTIHARIMELKPAPPKRSGSYYDHCGHCPLEPTERCAATCVQEAKDQGWYLPELF